MADLERVGFWSRFFGSFTGRHHLDKGGTAPPVTGAATASGSIVTANAALKISAVWACVRLRAETVSTLPLHLRTNAGEFATDHPLYGILHDTPNADMCAAEFWQAMTASQDLWGNAYARIHRNSGSGVVALEPLDSESMAVARTEGGAIGYRYAKGGKIKEYSEADILHFRGFSLDGLVGLSPIRYAAETLGGQLDANKAAQHEFKNGLKAGGFLKTGDRVLTQQQRTDLRAHMAEFSKPENAGKFMVLEAGMDLAGSGSIRINPADAQLLESRHFGIEEICRAFGTPPQLIGHTDKASSWASSLETTNIGFLTYSISPLLVRFEQTITRKLLKPAERSKYSPKFSVEGLLRADSSARAAFYNQMLQNGVMSRNEVRRLENLPPVEGGDVLTVQVNMTTLDKVGNSNENQAS
ncbi:phage portal protein [Neisseria musculi]|uniref:Phage portal protein HK97 family n=1 Tax=Neisseria musculi TaxID=1815583 RepID=A0A7H1MA62_9NEIS|nr:phage portal protein [Neisseria musculi]QNT58527.1 phage portal protein, HK97 family [Neisseria musculi]